MNLAEFIRNNLDPIVKNWEQFAQDIPAGHKMKILALRDHVVGILTAISADIESNQSDKEQSEKSKGHAEKPTIETHAMWHGAARLFQGFNINETLSEFRALRASVLRLWIDANKDEWAKIEPAAQELVRFNEAIDQALSESVKRFSVDSERNTHLFDTLLSASPDLNFLFNTEGKIIYANHAFTTLIGKPIAEFLDKNFVEISAPEADHLLQDLLISLRSKTIVRGEMHWLNNNNQVRTYDYFFVPIFDETDSVHAIAGTARDITERTQMEEKCRREANYDSLTGLPNRNLFRDRLEHEVNRVERSGTPLALLFIDLDGFKEVNDELGHAAGDQLLILAGQRIHACVRSTDTVARLGGDEFTVILTEMNRISSVELLAQEILTELARPFLIGQKEVKITGSMGITLCPHDGINAEDLLRNADQAMYVSKNAGRNRFSFFTVSMRDSAWARLKVIEQLRHALPLHQLVVVFQPVIELATGDIVKGEALLRWQHPEFGLMQPYEFVTLAEEIGAIGEIDAWVFNESLDCAKKWSAILGTDFQISVNKSGYEFSKNIISTDWSTQLANMKQASKFIAVEISEKIFMHDSKIAKDRLNDLKNSGVELIIDHFGIGHSLMAYMRKFDADYLKIDQSFIKDSVINEYSRTMCETMVVMAHKLGLKAIAPGVENIEQRDWLKGVDCDMAQGYFFSRALPSEEFAKLLIKQKEMKQPAKI